MSNVNMVNKNLWTEEKWRVWRDYCKKMKPFTDLMIHYRRFVEKGISDKIAGCAENWDIGVADEWYKKVMPTFLRMPNEDYDNNILFICEEKIMKNVFFSAFAKLPKFVDFKFVELLLIQELWYGRIQKKDYYEDSIETPYSFQDITQDVLCTYVSGDMAEIGKTPEILTTVILSRFENAGRRTKNQNTWIYFEGTIEKLRNSKFKLWEDFFKRNGVIIDLNPQSKKDALNTDIYSLY